MWVFLNNSFLSIVADKNNYKERLLVRARKKGDIEAVFKRFVPKLRVSHTPNNDYPYRTFVPRALVTVAMTAELDRVDYTNFKNSVPDKVRHDAYLTVWNDMRRWQNGEPRWTAARKGVHTCSGP
jgi:hypothetical protein